MTALSRGETPGPENSIGKLVSAPMAQDIAAFALDLLDLGGVVSDPELAPMRAAFQEAVLSTPGSRIAAGTDEILKNSAICRRAGDRAPRCRTPRERARWACAWMGTTQRARTDGCPARGIDRCTMAPTRELERRDRSLTRRGGLPCATT
jgi:hypothetical protein